MRMDDLKKVIAKLIRENFHQSLSEATYDFGKKQYTDKNMTPTEILDLAMAYANEPITKLVGKTLGHRIYVANDLAKLTGTTQSDVKTRGKQPALVLFLLKNGLVSKEEYAKIYKDLLAKQIQVIKYLKNASPDMRNSSSAMRAAEKDGRGEFGESVNEMSKNDVHFKEIMKMYDRGGSFTKKKVAVIVCRNSKASRRDIEEELLDTTYEDILQYQDELNIQESVEGDRIQKLNDRIKALRDKMNSTKSSTQKNLIQQRLKNALQALTKIKSGLGIKKINNESVNEAKFEVYHNSYTSAINAAREYAEKQGYTINDDDSFTKIGMGPKKPSEGKTNKFSIELSKDGKVQRKQLHIQVYGMRTKYELNCYIG
jgi:uncharacterized protein YdcH (DUF465 family)